jgi:hypothetical protein
MQAREEHGHGMEWKLLHPVRRSRVRHAAAAGDASGMAFSFDRPATRAVWSGRRRGADEQDDLDSPNAFSPHVCGRSAMASWVTRWMLHAARRVCPLLSETQKRPDSSSV